MREYTPMFAVLLRAKCHSACVILLAAGYQRMAAGSIGIHRPYFVGDEFLRLGYSDVKKAYDGLYGELASLFHNWNLSRTLIEDMFSIPSNEMRVLSERELDRYGLSRDDTVIVEQRNAETRAVCGMEAAASSADGYWWFTPEGNRCQDKIKEARRARAEASSTVADVPSGRGAPEHWSYSATLAFLVDCLAAYLLATRVNRAWIRILGAVGAGIGVAFLANLLLPWWLGDATESALAAKRVVAGAIIHSMIIGIGIVVVRSTLGKRWTGHTTEG